MGRNTEATESSLAMSWFAQVALDSGEDGSERSWSEAGMAGESIQQLVLGSVNELTERKVVRHLNTGCRVTGN